MRGGRLQASRIRMFSENSTAIFFTLFYWLFAFCFVAGPSDFRALGLTVDNILSHWLGSQDIDFINFHIKRTSATVIVHSFIPLGYILLLSLISDSGISPDQFLSLDLYIGWQVYFSLSLLLFIGGCTLVYYWSTNNWGNHPIARNLLLYVREDDLQRRSENVWRVKASEINNEYRRIDKFATTMSGWTKAIVTSSWIIVSSLYDVKCVPQDHCTLAVFATEEHDLSPESDFMVQFVNLRIKPTIKRELKPYFVRIQSVEFTAFKENVFKQIHVLPNVKIMKSTDELFLKEYHRVISQNERYNYDEDIEQCIGCLQKPAEVKLCKNCVEDCGECGCKPMWCAECMGKWFASRQNQRDTSTWLGGKATCPMCRTKFCLLDISFLAQ